LKWQYAILVLAAMRPHLPMITTVQSTHTT